MMTATTSLQAYWHENGDDPLPFSQPEAAVSEIERRYQIRLPEDFKSYLMTIAPKEDFWDAEDVIWWSPSRLKNVLDEYDGPIGSSSVIAAAAKTLFFADYMIWCWAWAICCHEGPDYGKVAIVGGSPDRWVADSFTDFVEKYMQEPAFVFKP